MHCKVKLLKIVELITFGYFYEYIYVQILEGNVFVKQTTKELCHFDQL